MFEEDLEEESNAQVSAPLHHTLSCRAYGRWVRDWKTDSGEFLCAGEGARRGRASHLLCVNVVPESGPLAKSGRRPRSLAATPH